MVGPNEATDGFPCVLPGSAFGPSVFAATGCFLAGAAACAAGCGFLAAVFGGCAALASVLPASVLAVSVSVLGLRARRALGSAAAPASSSCGPGVRVGPV